MCEWVVPLGQYSHCATLHTVLRLTLKYVDQFSSNWPRGISQTTHTHTCRRLHKHCTSTLDSVSCSWITASDNWLTVCPAHLCTCVTHTAVGWMRDFIIILRRQMSQVNCEHAWWLWLRTDWLSERARSWTAALRRIRCHPRCIC